MREELLAHYAGRWVAVYRGPMVADGYAYVHKVGGEETIVIRQRRCSFGFDETYQGCLMLLEGVQRLRRRSGYRPNRRLTQQGAWLKRCARWGLVGVIGFYGICCVSFLYLKWLPPLTTSVQIQRRIESVFSPEKYRKQYSFVRLSDMSPHLIHAAIASEDARFFEHHGIDWIEIDAIVTSAWRRGKLDRGGSTVTQQLVKNLFLTTHRSVVRKIPELTLAPLAELFLSKQRILELYLNVIEWGPGVYGAEAAARFYYGASARSLNREHAARLVACLPSPLTREPEDMDRRSARILARMRAMGW